MSVSRREFLKTSGVLIVSLSASALAGPLACAQGPFDTHPSHIDPDKLDSWIAVAGDGTVTAYTGKCDFGQGMFTAQTQLVAEELCIPIQRVKLIQCDTAVVPDQGTTSGSQSTPTNFNSDNLALAAATAREALVKMAAQSLGEPAEQLSIADGVIMANDGRHVRYEELIGNKRFAIPLSLTAKRRSRSQWTVLGKPIPSLDRTSLMTGQFEFVHNVRVPGMLHGRVVRPPWVGAIVADLDETSVRQVPGMVKVVRRQNFIGVVAEKQWQAVQAARLLKVTWIEAQTIPRQSTFYDAMQKQPSRDTLLVDSRDVEQQLAKADKVVKARYVYPHQMHGSVGTSCAVADIKPGQATVWSATQSVYPTRSIVAKVLELPLESVRIIYVRGSGCYGLNGADTVSLDAALLSYAVQKPVRVQLSRQDEMAWENFGSACVVEQSGGIDRNGNIVAWNCENWVNSRGGRPGYDTPGNVITGFLVGFTPELITAGSATPPREKLRNGSNAVPSYMKGCIEGNCGGAGTVRSERVLSHTVISPFFTGPLRSPWRIQNTFAQECFMDEMSATIKADPIIFRSRHLRDQRLLGVLLSAAKAAHWETRPSPKTHAGGPEIVAGRGVACVAYEGDNGYAALIAEIELNVQTGQVQPKKFTVALDCGPISNPDGLRNQIEGGILQGVSRTLLEEVTWNDKEVTSTDWETYHSLYLGFAVPTVNAILVETTGVPATGAGETAITVVAAALGNAIFDACGVRLREVPFTPERLKAALSQDK